MVEELRVTGNGEILKSRQIEMLMLHFPGAPDSASCAAHAGTRRIMVSIQKVVQNTKQTNNYAPACFAWME
jgi:hypothetical protein